MEKAIFKYNNGNRALLCSNCSKIIKEGYQFTDKEIAAFFGKYLEPQYCNECKKQKDE